MFQLNGWRVASLLLSLPSIFLLGAISTEPASAGDYGDYYGGHHRSYYGSTDCCYKRVVRFKRVYDDESYYRPRRSYYGLEDGYRSSYYTPPRRYSSDNYGDSYASTYGRSCTQSVKVNDDRGGWVWGKAYYC